MLRSGRATLCSVLMMYKIMGLKLGRSSRSSCCSTGVPEPEKISRVAKGHAGMNFILSPEAVLDASGPVHLTILSMPSVS